MDPLEGRFDKLAESFVSRLRRGELPSVDEYAKSHPELAEEINELFPALEMIERAAGDLSEGSRPEFPGLEVLEEIAPGVGGMGQVFRARETSLQRIVAVKTVKEHLKTSEGREWFVREARAAAALDHPHIVRIFSFLPDHNPPYYVMQFVEGRPLDQACEGRDARFCAKVFEKTARAMAYAHRMGIVHRDIKPANILVDDQGEPHITDFGLAKQAKRFAEAGDIDVTTFKGTPLYVAPEVYAEQRGSGPRTDVYALGVSLYSVLCGRNPFQGNTLDDVRHEVLRGRPRLPQELAPDVPEPLQRICLTAMAHDPDDRYESAEAMADDLWRFLSGREVLARPRRYQVELHGRIRNHLADIRVWLEQKWIDLKDMDRLRRPYRRVLDDDSPWQELSRRFPWETVSLRLGGWLVLISSILWPIWYWGQLNSIEKVTAIGLPTLLVTLVGWFNHRRGGRMNAVVFLTTGALLLPLFVTVLLSESGVLRLPQSSAREMFGDDVIFRPIAQAGGTEVPDAGWALSQRLEVEESIFRGVEGPWMAYESIAALPPEVRDDFEPKVVERLGMMWAEKLESLETPARHIEATNFQMMLSAGSFLAFGILLLVRVRARVFAVLIGVGSYLLYFSFLLLAGFLEWVEQEDVTRPLVLFLPLAFLFVLVARRLRIRAQGAWSPVFYMFFPVPLTVILTLLAYHGAAEMIRDLPVRRVGFGDEAVQLWLMANGPLYLLAGVWSTRATSGYVRLWAPFFVALVPFSFLVPCNVLFDEGPELFDLGSNPFRLYELAAATLSLSFVALGTRIRRPMLAFAGLAGTAVSILRATDYHFEEKLTWPTVLAILGALAMILGVIVTYLRSRRRAELENPPGPAG